MKSICLSIQIVIISSSLISAQSIDETFSEPLPIRPAKIVCMKMLSNEKVLIGGDIAFFNNKPVNNLVRLDSDGTIDETFNFKGDQALLIQKIEILKTGNIIE